MATLGVMLKLQIEGSLAKDIAIVEFRGIFIELGGGMRASTTYGNSFRMGAGLSVGLMEGEMIGIVLSIVKKTVLQSGVEKLIGVENCA